MLKEMILTFVKNINMISRSVCNIGYAIISVIIHQMHTPNAALIGSLEGYNFAYILFRGIYSPRQMER